MLIVQLYGKWPLDVENPFLFLAPPLGQICWALANAGRDQVHHWTIQPRCDSDVFSIADNRASSYSFCFELFFTLQLQLCYLEPVNSLCSSAIDGLLLQCLNERNGKKEIVKKTLCDYLSVCHHRDSWLRLQPFPFDWSDHYQLNPDTPQICTCIQMSLSHPHFQTPGFGFFGMYCVRDKWPLKRINCSSID